MQCRNLVELSFRNRLSFFFVIVVIVPMIAVAVVLFRLIADNDAGKANAAVAARAAVAGRLYVQDSEDPAARAATAAIAHDPVLGSAVSAGEVKRASVRAAQLLRMRAVVRIALVRGGRAVFDAGDSSALAPFSASLVGSGHRALGRLETSLTSAPAYAEQVRSATGLEVVVRVGRKTLVSSLPGAAPGNLPPPGRSGQLRARGVSYRTVSLSARGFDGAAVEITVLAAPGLVSADAGPSRLVAGALIAVFLVIALAFALLVSRSLQVQIGGFLEAARRLGSGDFSAKVPIVGRDEFAELGEEFNKMSGQLEDRLREIRDQGAQLDGALHRIGETFASNLDRDASMEIVLRTAVDGVGAAAGRASVSAEGGSFAERVRVGELSAYEDALNAVEAKMLSTAHPAELAVDGVSALGHPLTQARDPKTVLGMITVARADRSFTPAESDLFQYLAGQAAVSIERVDLHERVQRQAVTDELTGLYNHRRFHEAMAGEVERAKRFRQDLGLIMLDIDDFKRVNDESGHQQGDLVLREVARVMRECSREIDSPARYGGEELALVLPGTNLDGAYQLAERVRHGVQKLELALPAGNGKLRITVSLGVASVIPGPGAQPAELIAAADAALYEAKRSGKNKTVRAE
jgi:diguanylate cyclase (GGDEF)-like protein